MTTVQPERRCRLFALLLLAAFASGCRHVPPAGASAPPPLDGDRAAAGAPPSTVADAAPAPDPAATSSAASCAEHAGPLWQELSGLELERPDTSAPVDVTLPAGIALPPAVEDRGDECTVVGGIRALATPGRELRRCCRRAARGRDEAGFPMGCMMPFTCEYVIDGHHASDPSSLANLVGPITTPGQALGLVALHFVEILDPAVLDPNGSTPYAFRGLEGAPPAYAVEPVEGTGFRVHAAALSTCGCFHHLARLTFEVSRAGCVRRVDAPPEPIAWSAGLCID